jgi:hypothetical protein
LVASEQDHVVAFNALLVLHDFSFVTFVAVEDDGFETRVSYKRHHMISKEYVQA